MAWKTQKPGMGPASGIPAGGKSMWGGASGNKARAPFTAENQPPAEHKRIARMEAEEYREELKKRRRPVLAVIDAALAAGVPGAEPAALSVAMKAVAEVTDRLDGRAAQSVDMTSKGERLPGYVMTAPAEIEDAAEWTTRHKPQPRE